uniref:Uncharacterized protein n=1 Tax=Leersia perrieri TaxID=77586 RepID=A0A0D9WWL5_9ORYZ
MAKYPSPNQAMAAIIDVATSAAASSPPQLHIVVFPWLAFGHMIPFLELSKRLARRGHAVTFISTPRNAARLGAIPPELLARLRIVSLDLPAVDGLPNGAESTADVPQEKIGLLKKAFDGLAVPFAGLIADICTNAGDGDAAINATGFSRKPDWIILDFAQYWIWPIADEHEKPAMAATREVATTASSPRPLHIVVFPWLAFGHMIPFLELSKRLARRGHAVTFVSTPRNVVRLGAIPPELSVRLRVVSLNLPAVDGLPEGAESTTDVPPDKIELFKIAFDGLAAQFASLIGGNGEDDGSTGFSRKPDWIIQDVVQNWTGSIAEEHKIPCASFNIFPAAMVAFLGPKKENLAHPRTKTEDYMVKPPWITFPANLAFRRHEAEWIATMFKPNASGVADIDRFWSIEHPCCRLIIYRSCLEAEPPMSPILTDLFAKPALPAGLLIFPEIVDDDAVIVSDQSFLPAIEWLDEKPDKSVIYVALGSEAPVTADHVRELAFGLELADVNFIWAIRPPSHGAFLPNGFESCVAHAGWCARSGYRSCACLRIVRSGVS